MSILTDNKVLSLLKLNEKDIQSSINLREYASQYPFSSLIQLLYTRELKAKNDIDFDIQSRKTSLFFPFSPHYHYLLHHELQVEDTLIHSNEGSDIISTAQPEFTVDGVNIPLEPYHTIDYFASQGINISQIDDKDDFGKKVKSFTAWLKTMKRLQPEQSTQNKKDEVLDADLSVLEANEPETIVTEAMADVYQKQGLTEKAIDIYHKLSLQNPDNRLIFADKISALKENKT